MLGGDSGSSSISSSSSRVTCVTVTSTIGSSNRGHLDLLSIG